MKSESEVAQSCPTLYDPMNCSLPGSSVHGFPRQKYWSGLPFPSPGDLPDPGIKPGSPEFPANSTIEPPGAFTERFAYLLPILSLSLDSIEF